MAGGVRILHLIDRLTLGGAGRSLITAAAHGAQTGRSQHRIASLRPADPAAATLAAGNDIELIPPDCFDSELAAADILHVHFWNTPALHAVLAGALPPCRIVLTAHVVGTTPPHILTERVVALADTLILTGEGGPAGHAAGRPAARAVQIPSVADLKPIAASTPVTHPGFVIGYVGTVDFAKMHPDHVALHTGLDIPDATILVAGDGGASRVLAAQIAATGQSGAFRLLGRVADVAGVLARLDVFGYPLRADAYATTELVLHEAMAAALPVVVMAPRAATGAVVDGVTGFIVADAADYRARLRQLAADPALRRRMGQAGAARARAAFGAANIVPQIEAVYDDVAARPRRARAAAARDPRDPHPGATALVDALGWAATPFRTSRDATGDVALAADAVIAGAPPALASADAGGVLHYRRHYPDDVLLRLWAGLVLLGGGRPALAAGEFKVAAAAGFDPARADAHLARAVATARAAARQNRATAS